MGELWGLEGESLRGAQALLRAADAHDRIGQSPDAQRLRARAEELHTGAADLTMTSPEMAAAAAAASPLPEIILPDLGRDSDARSSFRFDHGRSGQRAFHGRGTRLPCLLRASGSRGGRSRDDRPASRGWLDRRAHPGGVRTRGSGENRSLDRGRTRRRVDLAGAGARVPVGGERERAAEELLAAAQSWEAQGGLEEAASIYHELSKSPQATERLYRLWLANCERRQQWPEASVVCCELGDLALAAQEPASAHEWFVQALSYDPENQRAGRRLERLKEWGERTQEPQQGSDDRITVTRRMSEDFDVDVREIVHAFQEGVQNQVQMDDARSRFDLGMTYRQMGLLDEAVAEFRLASRSPLLRVMALDMLGRALLERGDFGAAIAELERALATPDVPIDAEVNFRYNLGLALEAGDASWKRWNSSRACFRASPITRKSPSRFAN